MNILSISSAIFASLLACSALAQPVCEAYSTTNGRWLGDGPNQGLWTASITNGTQNEIYFSCDLANGRGSTMTLCLNGVRPTEPVVYMRIDGGHRGEYHLNYFDINYFTLRGGLAVWTDDLFENTVEALRRGTAVTIDDGKGNESTFTLAGSNEALSDCPARFPG